MQTWVSRKCLFDVAIHRCFHSKGDFSIFRTWQWLTDVCERQSITVSRDRACRDYIQQIESKSAEQFHQIIEGEVEKNCCTIRVSKQIKHTHINNLKRWGVSDNVIYLYFGHHLHFIPLPKIPNQRCVSLPHVDDVNTEAIQKFSMKRS